jgi:hypothetical protein
MVQHCHHGKECWNGISKFALWPHMTVFNKRSICLEQKK